MAENSVVLVGVGDVGPVFGPVEPLSSLVRPALAAADIRFGNCERVFSELGTLNHQGGSEHARVKPHMASIFTDCGFDVLSVANNHAMDWGPDALMDTIALLRKKGIQTVGAGRNIEEARQPAIIERNGVKIAFLAYCSVLHEGYEATKDKVGIAPLRARTYYEPISYPAGLPPKVVTVPYENDMEAMVNDIKAAKKAADVVVVSNHWGVQMIPRLIADYQTIAAEATFKAGADLILGHHAHIPKAIGVHDGKVCFYSLSNFIVSSPPTAKGEFARRYGISRDPAYPKMDYGVDAKHTLIAKAVLTRQGVKKASFLPVLIDTELRPEVLRHGDPRFDDNLKYMDWASEWFDHKFTVEGDEVVITGK